MVSLYKLLCLHACPVTGVPNPSQITTTEFSVQSSFKLNLPPHLIITASSVKLNEIIGQGIFYSLCTQTKNCNS